MGVAVLKLIQGSRTQATGSGEGGGKPIALETVSSGGVVHLCRHSDAGRGAVVCLRKGHCAGLGEGDSEPGVQPETDQHRDDGMSTVEYAIGTVVAAAFAAVLYRIVTGDSVVSGLTELINSALSTSL